MPARAASPALRSQASWLTALLFVLGGTVVSSATETGTSQIVAITIDNAKIMRLPEKTQTVVVGNPIIADVALQRNGVVILTGKSFGQTNLIALDGNGAMLAETAISVRSADQASTVTVQRGSDKRNSYSCTPNCQRSMQLGDSNEYFSEVSSQADVHRNLASAGTR